MVEFERRLFLKDASKYHSQGFEDSKQKQLNQSDIAQNLGKLDNQSP